MACATGSLWPAFALLVTFLTILSLCILRIKILEFLERKATMSEGIEWELEILNVDLLGRV